MDGSGCVPGRHETGDALMAYPPLEFLKVHFIILLNHINSFPDNFFNIELPIILNLQNPFFLIIFINTYRHFENS